MHYLAMDNFRPTWAEIDLRAVKHNYAAIKRLIPPDVKVMAVVKANAYGHGSIEVAKALEEDKVSYLGVATLDEAIKLRNAGITSPVLVMGSVFPHELEPAAQYSVTLTMCNNELVRSSAEKNIKLKVHIKVDTGMGRIGVWHEEACEFVKNIFDAHKNLEIEGIYTHFSIAGRDKFFTQYQIDSFTNVVQKLEAYGINIPIKHAANSIATAEIGSSYFNMVRPGLIIYGMSPKRGALKGLKLKPVISLKTKVAFVKDVGAGRAISYGRTYITQGPARIVTLPIGYADGYGRILSGKASVMIKGRMYPVVGKVTMDQTMVDTGANSDIKVGDEVVLIGRQMLSEIKVEDLAKQAGTIPYEIVTGITARVPRTYIR